MEAADHAQSTRSERIECGGEVRAESNALQLGNRERDCIRIRGRRPSRMRDGRSVVWSSGHMLTEAWDPMPGRCLVGGEGGGEGDEDRAL
jgi:hypothetical protein